LPTACAGDILDDLAERMASYERDLMDLLEKQKDSLRQWQGNHLRNYDNGGTVDAVRSAGFRSEKILANAAVPFKDLFGSDFLVSAFWKSHDATMESDRKRQKKEEEGPKRQALRRVRLPYVSGTLDHLSKRFSLQPPSFNKLEVLHMEYNHSSKKVEFFSRVLVSPSRLQPKFQVDLAPGASAEIGGFLQELLASRLCSVGYFVNVIVGPNMGQDFQQRLSCLNEKHGEAIVGLANGNMPRGEWEDWPVLRLVCDDYLDEEKQLWDLAKEASSAGETELELHVAWSYLQEEKVYSEEQPLVAP